MTADVDHGVDRRAAAERAALRIVHLAVVELRLGHRGKAPVDTGAGQLGEAGRHVDQRRAVGAAGLEQQNPVGRVGAEAIGNGAPGGAGAGDDVRVAGLGHGSLLLVRSFYKNVLYDRQGSSLRWTCQDPAWNVL